MARPDISNDDLKRAQLPDDRSSWDEIEMFALTFNGYEQVGDGLADLANGHSSAGTVPQDLDELRACLFFEQRRWRHFGQEPDETAMRHIRALIEGIRGALKRMEPIC